MRALRRKQNVWVPEFPGQQVFEEYHGVPADQYIARATNAARTFAKLHNGCNCSLRTIDGTWRVDDVDAQMSGKGISVNGRFHIQPTKWGTDTIDGGRERFWFFDDRTLSEMDIVCSPKKG